MSDQFDNFMKNNRGKFDQSTPGKEVWSNINKGLNQAAAGAGASSAGAGAAGKAAGGVAKIASLWKAVAAIIAVGITAGGIYLATSSGSKNNGEESLAAQQTGNENQKVELIEESAPFINPPMKEVTIPFDGYAVDAGKGGEIRTKTGTVITIPAGAFVDAQGNPVSGEVTINYREFHDAADLILSGIPMKYEEDGKVHDFQTAGMMEISGTQGESPVFIAQGKNLQVALASYTDEDNYGLYYLDQDEKRWKDIGKAKMGKNKSKEEGLRMLPTKPKKPNKPVKGTESENTFDFAVDFKQFPELKPFKKIVWQAVDEAEMKQNEWAYEELWTNVKLEAKNRERGIYTLTLSNRSKEFKTDIVPALDGKDYEKAMASFNKKMDKYDQLLVQREQEEDRLNAQADVLRTFNIAMFGVYNCDRFVGMPGALRIAADFDFGDDVYMKASQTAIFHITGENRSVIPYQGDFPGVSFAFSPTEENYLVAVMPGKKLGVFHAKDFRQLDINRIRNEGKYTFKLRTIDKEITSAQDIRDALGV